MHESHFLCDIGPLDSCDYRALRGFSLISKLCTRYFLMIITVYGYGFIHEFSGVEVLDWQHIHSTNG